MGATDIPPVARKASKPISPSGRLACRHHPQHGDWDVSAAVTLLVSSARSWVDCAAPRTRDAKESHPGSTPAAAAPSGSIATPRVRWLPLFICLLLAGFGLVLLTSSEPYKLTLPDFLMPKAPLLVTMGPQEKPLNYMEGGRAGETETQDSWQEYGGHDEQPPNHTQGLDDSTGTSASGDGSEGAQGLQGEQAPGAEQAGTGVIDKVAARMHSRRLARNRLQFLSSHGQL